MGRPYQEFEASSTPEQPGPAGLENRRRAQHVSRSSRSSSSAWPAASSSRSSIRRLFASYVPACKTDGPRCVHFRLGVGCGGDVRSLSREG
jgi:hypothetical protein